MQSVAMVGKTPKKFDVFKTAIFYPAIDEALDRSCPKGIKREPCYTAVLTKELPKILNDIIDKEAQRSNLPPKYRFGACYVHQKPYVKFGPDFKLRCELGDLLVLVKRIINGSVAFNASLFQLKKTKSKKHRISENQKENNQLILYTKWGKLKIDLKTEIGTIYDVTPYTVSQGGSYMFVRQDRQNPKFVIAVPNREMETAPPPSLGCYLSNMVEGLCGRAIAPKSDVRQGCADDWSRMIWKVIDLLHGATSKCKEYGNVTRDNGCGSLSFLIECPEIVSIGEVESPNIDENEGFGVLCIEELNNEEKRSVKESGA